MRNWNRGIGDGERFTSIIVIAELMKGSALRRRRDIAGGAILDRWISGVVAEFEGRILPIDFQPHPSGRNSWRNVPARLWTC